MAWDHSSGETTAKAVALLRLRAAQGFGEVHARGITRLTVSARRPDAALHYILELRRVRGAPVLSGTAGAAAACLQGFTADQRARLQRQEKKGASWARCAHLRACRRRIRRGGSRWGSGGTELGSRLVVGAPGEDGVVRRRRRLEVDEGERRVV